MHQVSGSPGHHGDFFAAKKNDSRGWDDGGIDG